MANNPYAGKVPLNLRVDSKKVGESTSYRSGEVHKPEYRSQYNDRTILPRNPGCEVLRRYPNGVLDVDYVLHKIIDIIHKIQDQGNVTDYEKAVLSLVLPAQFKKLIDPKIAQTMTKLSNEERMLLAIKLRQNKAEELNYNAGLGGGSVSGRSQTRS